MARRLPTLLSTIALVALVALVLIEGTSIDGAPLSQLTKRRHLPSADAAIKDLTSCAAVHPTEGAATAAAIVASETALRHPLEALYEEPLIWIGRATNFDPPALSLGPAQISPKHYVRLTGSLDGYWAIVADRCATLAWTTRWVEANASKGASAADERQALFAKWSGHLPADTDTFETAVYFSFCEHLFWRARRALEEKHRKESELLHRDNIGNWRHRNLE